MSSKWHSVVSVNTYFPPWLSLSNIERVCSTKHTPMVVSLGLVHRFSADDGSGCKHGLPGPSLTPAAFKALALNHRFSFV